MSEFEIKLSDIMGGSKPGSLTYRKVAASLVKRGDAHELQVTRL